ncbi:DUF4916 domain-containing protein [Streptomyces sp. KL116D]|uniref:DUF4916 domain-containing protein n=1 Tax=Streptomyces sp. KL116D TaxID=3045152 RepID=UPI003557167B
MTPSTTRASTRCHWCTWFRVSGDCALRQDALDLVWFTPQEALSEAVQNEMQGGRGVLLRQVLAHVGALIRSERPVPGDDASDELRNPDINRVSARGGGVRGRWRPSPPAAGHRAGSGQGDPRPAAS